MGKQIVIITGDEYPNESAGAVRTHSFAKIFSALGYVPHVIGMGGATSFQWSEYDHVSYCSLRYTSKKLLSRLLGRLLFGYNLKNVLKHCAASDIAGIMWVSGGKNALRYVKRFSRRYSIPLYYDCVEWYSPSEFLLGKFSPEYRENNRINTRLIDQNFRVFSISSYLDEHFKSRQISTVRIPVILDVQHIPFRETRNDAVSNPGKIRMIYAGSPGRKDRLREMVKAIGMLSPENREKIEFHIVGITLDGYEKIYGERPQSELLRSVFFDGRQSRSTVLQMVADSDFAFLLRPANERYAMAGFPTKVAESLSLGTPMLCNLSSDLSIYLENGVNSVLIEDCTVEACSHALNYILALRRDQIDQMRISARKTAEGNFDWRNYTSVVGNLL